MNFPEKTGSKGLRAESGSEGTGEKSHREHEAMLRAIMNASTEGIHLMDRDGTILEANDAIGKRLGTTREALIGTNVWAMLSCEVAAERKAVVDQVFAGGLPVTIRDIREGRHIESIVYPVFNEGGEASRVAVFSLDVTERDLIDTHQKVTVEILELINQSSVAGDLIPAILAIIKGHLDMEAVGIRLREENDYPYFYTSGFPGEFVEAEGYLCSYDTDGNPLRDGQGNPVLECMCGNILQGRFNPELPFFSQGGSFWSNSTTKLLASATEEDRQARTRNRCNGEGYESVALIPLRSEGSIIGLLQFNDRRTDRFSEDTIGFLEKIGNSVGVAVARLWLDEALREGEERFRTLTALSPAGIFLTDKEGNCLYVNESWRRMAGMSLEEALGRGWERAVHPDDRERIASSWYDMVASNGRWGLEYRFVTPGGQVTWIYGLAKAIFDGDGNIAGYIGANTDITDRKLLEADLLKSHSLLNETQRLSKVGGWEYDVAGGKISWTDETYRIHGVPRDFDPCDVEKNIRFYAPGDRDLIEKAFYRAVNQGEPYDLELRFTAGDGTEKWVRTVGRPVMGENGTASVTGNLSDITDRKHLEDELRVSLKEKEILLRELHHRVKNNLQVVMSLLDMSCMRTRDGEAANILKDTKNRIHAMALVHNQLYQAPELDRINMEGQIREMMVHLSQAYAMEGRKIVPLVQVEDVRLPVQQAMSCALILNELISNAYKHAFRQKAEGAITISMSRPDDKMIRLTVQDDGHGIPEDIDLEKAETLGLKLVRNLGETQLKGKVFVGRGQGATITVDFRIHDKEGR